MNESQPCPTPRTDADVACECIDKLASECKLNPTAYQREGKERVRSLERELIQERKDHFKNIETERELKSQKRQKIESLERELIATQLELQKWKDGCLVNADNAKDALRRSDELRLDLKASQLALKECADMIKWLYENTSHCYPLEYDRKITKALSNPLTIAAMKGK